MTSACAGEETARGENSGSSTSPATVRPYWFHEPRQGVLLVVVSFTVSPPVLLGRNAQCVFECFQGVPWACYRLLSRQRERNRHPVPGTVASRPPPCRYSRQECVVGLSLIGAPRPASSARTTAVASPITVNSMRCGLSASSQRMSPVARSTTWPASSRARISSAGRGKGNPVAAAQSRSSSIRGSFMLACPFQTEVEYVCPVHRPLCEVLSTLRTGEPGLLTKGCPLRQSSWQPLSRRLAECPGNAAIRRSRHVQAFWQGRRRSYRCASFGSP